MAKESLKLYAYNLIKEKIISCEYPPGTLLNEELLREEFNVSRTPIRDALSRLEQEGLITILPKKGIMVSSLSLGELNMIFEIRLLFEPYAVMNYGYTFDGNALLEYYQLFSQPIEKLSNLDIYALDDRFHAMIMDSVPNTYMKQCNSMIHNQNLRFRVMTGNCTSERLIRTHQEHLDIIKACLKKDWPGASDAMKKHLLESKNSTFELLLNTPKLN
ncbi:MAG: GntR family transcriptional regulator, rspAB operon transcriptional repressor [Clostridiales bacterium]|nr:GntR family transcriptional regulator, rspAB operon transcriptional repressor [Clostridiales bacterium]